MEPPALLETPPAVPDLAIQLRKAPRRKSASARIRGQMIEVVVPQHWPKSTQTDISRELALRVKQQFKRDWELLHHDQGPRITLTHKPDLIEWINTLNQQTLKVPLQGIRLGSAKHTRLAQMNTRTHVMTVSRFCLIDVPVSALTYLIVHELAHIKVPNHSKAFWAEVRAFIPDLKYQQRLISATHRIRLYEAEVSSPSPAPALVTLAPPKAENLLKQLLFKLF